MSTFSQTFLAFRKKHAKTRSFETVCVVGSSCASISLWRDGESLTSSQRSPPAVGAYYILFINSQSGFSKN